MNILWIWSIMTSPAHAACLSFITDVPKWRRVMLHLVQLDRSYTPETIAVMGAAFEKVCQSISKQMNGNDDLKKTLALIILRHADREERDPERLAETALREWTGTDRSALGDRWAATG
jgi:hypothetical protein